MAKNNDLINRYKNLAETNRDIVPAIFSSLALAMDEAQISADDIEYLFARSQEIWRDHVGTVKEMMIKCEQRTGIDVRGY